MNEKAGTPSAEKGFHATLAPAGAKRLGHRTRCSTRDGRAPLLAKGVLAARRAAESTHEAWPKAHRPS